MGGILGFDAEMGRNISADRAPRTSLHLLCCLVAHFAPTKSEDNAISETADFCLKLSMTINDGIGE
jgi:hypothetical protein